MQVDFDPTQITFAEIVELFWNVHNPCGGSYSRQYMAAIWYHDDHQREVIQQAAKRIASALKTKVRTPILPLDIFYAAENYHQKYCLQQSPLMTRFRAMYPRFPDFNNSTAAARLNGFVAGRGSRELFDAEHEQYGFPVEELRQSVRLHDA